MVRVSCQVCARLDSLRGPPRFGGPALVPSPLYSSLCVYRTARLPVARNDAYMLPWSAKDEEVPALSACMFITISHLTTSACAASPAKAHMKGRRNTVVTFSFLTADYAYAFFVVDSPQTKGVKGDRKRRTIAKPWRLKACRPSSQMVAVRMGCSRRSYRQQRRQPICRALPG